MQCSIGAMQHGLSPHGDWQAKTCTTTVVCRGSNCHLEFERLSNEPRSPCFTSGLCRERVSAPSSKVLGFTYKVMLPSPPAVFFLK